MSKWLLRSMFSDLLSRAVLPTLHARPSLTYWTTLSSTFTTSTSSYNKRKSAATCPTHRRWTKDEDEMLQSLQQQGKDWPEIAATMQRSASATRTRFLRLRQMALRQLSPPRSRVPYTAAEDALIVKMRNGGSSWAHIAAVFPGRSVEAIMTHYHGSLRGGHHLNTKSGRTWTPDEIVEAHRLRTDVGMSYAQIADRFGRTYQSISGLFKVYGVPICEVSWRAKRWKPEEDQKLLSLRAQAVPWHIVALQLPGRSIAAARHRLSHAQQLRTRSSSPQAVLQTDTERRSDDEVGSPSLKPDP